MTQVTPAASHTIVCTKSEPHETENVSIDSRPHDEQPARELKTTSPPPCRLEVISELLATAR
jgi:hypothetical protein